MNNPFDWKSFTDKLREQLPNSNVNSDAPNKLDFSWIQQYVEDTLEQSLGHSFKKKSTNRSATPPRTENQPIQLQPKLMHTLTEIIVRIDVPEGLNAKRIRVESNAHRMKLRVLPQQKAQTILFPAKVLHRRVQAICQQKKIEIRLPKNPDIETFHPVTIRHDE